MPPRRPRRRARRRSPGRPVTLLVAAAIVLAVIVGGLTQVSRQSQGYDANADRTLAAQGTVVADQSNATSATVRRVVNDLPAQTRQDLQAALDGAVQQTADESSRADLAAGATPLGQVATQLTAVFAERAQSMAQLRAAVDGFLGMQPIPPADTTSDAQAPNAGSGSASLGDSGHKPHCRGRCAARPLRRSLPLGAAHPVHRSRPREAPSVGVGDAPATLATWQRGGPGRSPGHLVHAVGDALRRLADRALEPAFPADSARRVGDRVRAQPHLPDRCDRGPGQPGFVRRAARLGPLHPGRSDLWRDDDPGPGDVAGAGRLGHAPERDLAA